MSLDSIVNVTIQVGTSQPSQRGFGVPLLLAYHTRFTENVRTYSRLSEMISDGFTVNDPAYLMASKVFAQNPRPPQIKLGRLPTPGSAHSTEIDVTGIVSGESVTMTVRDSSGNTTAVSEAFDTNEGTTATNLASTLNAISGMSASASVNVVTVVADSNGPMVFFEDTTNCTILDVTGDWAYDTQLGVIANEDPDFYAVAIDVNSDANVTDVAAWVNTTERIAAFGPQSTDPDDYNTATADALTSGNDDRSFSLVTKKGRSSFPECAWLGEALPWLPGSQTWAYKSPSGLVADDWSSSDITELDTANNNYATTVSALTVIRPGKTHGGEWIDVTRGIDWIKARIQESLFAVLVQLRKIPFTNSGVEIIKAEIQAVLDVAVAQGILSDDPENRPFVTAPNVSDVPVADRNNRILSGVEFQGTLAGAVHSVTLIGNVSV